MTTFWGHTGTGPRRWKGPLPAHNRAFPRCAGLSVGPLLGPNLKSHAVCFATLTGLHGIKDASSDTRQDRPVTPTKSLKAPFWMRGFEEAQKARRGSDPRQVAQGQAGGESIEPAGFSSWSEVLPRGPADQVRVTLAFASFGVETPELLQRLWTPERPPLGRFQLFVPTRRGRERPSLARFEPLRRPRAQRRRWGKPCGPLQWACPIMSGCGDPCCFASPRKSGVAVHRLMGLFQSAVRFVSVAEAPLRSAGEETLGTLEIPCVEKHSRRLCARG